MITKRFILYVNKGAMSADCSLPWLPCFLEISLVFLMKSKLYNNEWATVDWLNSQVLFLKYSILKVNLKLFLTIWQYNEVRTQIHRQVFWLPTRDQELEIYVHTLYWETHSLFYFDHSLTYSMKLTEWARRDPLFLQAENLLQ